VAEVRGRFISLFRWQSWFEALGYFKPCIKGKSLFLLAPNMPAEGKKSILTGQSVPR
jgi:hypothetical protein